MPITWIERLDELAQANTAEDCWLWTGRIDPDGYGAAGANRRAHRLAYVRLVGSIPDGLEIDHLCQARSCVNPRHMEPVTQDVNKLRSTALPALNAVKTHCDQGHPFDEANTYVYAGSRRCRACNRVASAESSRRRRARAAREPLDAAEPPAPMGGGV